MTNTGKELEEGKKIITDWYLKYRQYFFNYFNTFSLTDEELKDVYQESMIALYQSIVTKRFDSNKSSMKTYLIGIGKNKISSLIKNKQKELTLSQDEARFVKDFQEDELTLEQKLLRKHFQRLGYKCKNILEMFYYRGLTIKEIVDHAGYKDENTVKSQKSRCLKQLRTMIKNS